jgi:hypothetical protein
MVMAAIVATLACVPMAVVLVLFSLGIPDVSIRSLVTFGGRFNAFVGVVAWWAIAFVPALTYAGFTMPTDPTPRP